ncbi:MAG: serine/threonine-protein kinase [Lysobacteraceae bacterium]
MTQPGRDLQQAATVGMATLTGFLMASELRQGDIVAQRYRIEQLLGMGGMGLVYQAWDSELNVAVALKLLRPELASRPDAFDRFRQELLLARQVSSPHVVRIHDLVRHESAWMISMDFVDGESLERRLDREGALPAEEALRIAREIALGLAAAHHRGVIHRDLKPANILLTRSGEARITDFGVARSAGSTGITGSGVVIGTPAYLSPEQARADKLDGRSDLYALGLILYEMLTGVLPFRNGTAAEMLAQRLFRSPDPPDTLKSGLPPLAVQLCAALLEIRPAHRLQSADAVVAAIASGRLPRQPSSRRRTRLAWGLSALMIVLSLGAISVWRSPLVDRIVDAWQVEQNAFDLAILPWHVASNIAVAADGQPTPWQGIADAAYALLQANGEASTTSSVAPQQLIARSLQSMGFDSETAMRHRAQVMQTLGVRHLLTIDLRREAEQSWVRVALSNADHPDSPDQAEARFDSIASLNEQVVRLAGQLLQKDQLAWQPQLLADSTQALVENGESGEDIADPAFWWARMQRALDEPDSEATVSLAESALKAMKQSKAPAERRVRALALALQGDEGAETALREVLQQRTDPTLQYQLAMLLLAEERDDEARAALLDSAETDRNNPDIWFQLGRLAILNGQAGEAVEDYLLRGLILASRVKDREAQARITNAIGMGYRSLGQPDQAIDNFDRAARLWRQLGHSEGEATALLNLGSERSLQGDFDAASEALGRAETLARELGDRSLLADVENDLGVMYEEQGRFDTALSSYREALAHRQELGDPSQLISSLLNVGFAYYHLGEFDNAQVYWQQAESQAKDSRDVARILQANHAKALAMMARGDLSTAAALVDAQIQQAESMQLGEDIPTAFAMRAQLALLTGQISIGLDAARKALGLFQQRGDARGETEMRLVLLELALETLDQTMVNEAAIALDNAPPESAEQRAKWHLLRARADPEAEPDQIIAQLDQALEAANRAHSLPLQAEALLALAVEHHRAGRAAQASSLLERARSQVNNYPSVDLRLQLILSSLRIQSSDASADYHEARTLLQRIGPWRSSFSLHVAAMALPGELASAAARSAAQSRQQVLSNLPESATEHFDEITRKMLTPTETTP